MWAVTHEVLDCKKMLMRPQKKKETMFYRWTDLPGRVGRSVGRSGHLFYLSSGKNDSPKKTQIYPKNWCFLEKNILSYFPKIFSEIFVEFGQKRLIRHDFSKLKKRGKISQFGKIGSPKTEFSFLWSNGNLLFCRHLQLLIFWLQNFGVSQIETQNFIL